MPVVQADAAAGAGTAPTNTAPEQGEEGEAAVGRASGGGLGSSIAVIKLPGIPAAALAVGGDMSSAIPASEKTLMKGLYR